MLHLTQLLFELSFIINFYYMYMLSEVTFNFKILTDKY